MSNDVKNQGKVFTWRNGPWICLRSNGIIYYSEKITNQLFTDNINYVTYQITSSKLKIYPHDENNENIKYYKLTRINNGARSFIKRTLNKNDFTLPTKSLRLFADISESHIIVDLSELKS